MFSCFNPNKTLGPKCEWRDGNLQEFVRQYNRGCGTSYELAECLDVPRSGVPFVAHGQPEVLVTGKRNEQPMVIERKQVVPESYAKHHANQHLIYDIIPHRLMPRYSGDLYALEINDADLHDKTKSTIEAEVLQIADYVLANVTIVMQGQSISGRNPFPWRFGRMHEQLRDERAPSAGIGINIRTRGIFDRSPSDGLRLIEKTQTEYRELVGRALTSAARKFRTYLNHRKVIVLEFYGDLWSLNEDDARNLVSEASLPPLIDEVWITIPEWVSESDYEIAYERIR